MRILALAGIVLGWAAVTFAYSAWVVRRPGRLPTAINYRGVQLPLCLGMGLGLLLVWIYIFRAGWIIDASVRTTTAERRAIAASLALVLLAGWYDDYRAGSTRGIRRHLRELVAGRITPGLVKLVVILGAAAWASLGLDDRPVRILVGIPMMAGAANLWNFLDVRPGRALKWFLVVALALAGWYVRYDDFLLTAAVGSAAALLIWDLRERAMLGDAGSNGLGFLIGLAFFRLLPTWGLGIALALILILHGLGETVTLSRLIEASPPLRWFDRLGRLRIDQANPESGPDSRDSAAT